MDKLQVVDWNVTLGGHSDSRTSIAKNWVVDLVVPGGQIVVDIVVDNMVLGGQTVEIVGVEIDLDTLALRERVLR